MSLLVGVQHIIGQGIFAETNACGWRFVMSVNIETLWSIMFRQQKLICFWSVSFNINSDYILVILGKLTQIYFNVKSSQWNRIWPHQETCNTFSEVNGNTGSLHTHTLMHTHTHIQNANFLTSSRKYYCHEDCYQMYTTRQIIMRTLYVIMNHIPTPSPPTSGRKTVG